MSILKLLGSTALTLAALVAPGIASAGTFTTLYGFTSGGSPNGANPQGALHYFDGAIYGTTTYGGSTVSSANGWGTVFKLQLAGNSESTLFSFLYSDVTGGVWPTSLAGNGEKLFAVMSYGGSGQGAIAELNVNTAKATDLHAFATGNTDGKTPLAVHDVAGILYGVTMGGGTYGAGVLYSIDVKTGVQTILHQFAGGADGATPSIRGQLVDDAGAIYGATSAGGSAGLGVIFKYDISTGTESVLYNFNAVRGDTLGGITFGDGKLYGVTSGLNGTVFSVVISTGVEKDIYYFSGGTDGAASGPLTYYKGILYGEGGTGIFQIDPATGVETSLHTFTAATDGQESLPAPLLEVNGSLYGVAYASGPNGGGTIFEYTP